jgi:ABC-2 type transport system ATP-binding protein
VASLDPVARRQFLEELVGLSADGGRSIVFSSHIVSDIERLATRVWILKEGRLAWEGDLGSLKESLCRLHIHSSGATVPAFAIPGAINRRTQGRTVTALVRDWSDDRQRELEARHEVTVERETLGLEEIFLEMHR